MMEGFSQRLDNLASKVDSDRGANNGMTSTEVPPFPSPSLVTWADVPIDEPLDAILMPLIRWPDNEEAESSANLVEVSTETAS